MERRRRGRSQCIVARCAGCSFEVAHTPPVFNYLSLHRYCASRRKKVPAARNPNPALPRAPPLRTGRIRELRSAAREGGVRGERASRLCAQISEIQPRRKLSREPLAGPATPFRTASPNDTVVTQVADRGLGLCRIAAPVQGRAGRTQVHSSASTRARLDSNRRRVYCHPCGRFRAKS